MKKPFKLLSILLVLAMVVLMMPAALWAAPALPDVPGPPIYVQDYANLLDDRTKNNIIGLGKQIDDRSGAQLVVVTVDNLDGYPIKDYANELFRKWGIGDKKKNNGVLLLVNKENLLAGKPGKVRIEVGYGLEGAIPDGKAGRILDNYVLPRWKNGNYSNGIWQGYQAIAGEVAKEYNFNLDAKYAPQPAVQEWSRVAQKKAVSGADFVRGFIFMLVLIGVLSSLARKSGRRGRHGGWHDGGFGGWGGGGGGGFGGGDGGGFGGGSSGGGGADR